MKEFCGSAWLTRMGAEDPAKQGVARAIRLAARTGRRRRIMGLAWRVAETEKFRASTIEPPIGCDPLCCAKHMPDLNTTAPPFAPLKHDPEKCGAAFRKDHARTII
ncbi:hypothetical protein GCM10007857_59290 [Bradyrhizobium iriomotense]|uniref:Uncharacterized protein n=1 Tax=Bradyrhizobium iriomotense TaxID=441950 RepID=A0ABQ6B5V6_9BRAD|nr:hypothetical protein GCM10007857_59290 [Bradyrhizobium iriomotense]